MFQLLCVNGCGNKPNDFLIAIDNILTYGKFIVLGIGLLLIIFYLIKWLISDKKKRDSGKKIFKKLMKIALITIAIFIVIVFLHLVFGWIFNLSKYDNSLKCWCA